MPTYEYRCEKCGHEFEREQRITEDPIRTCPACKSQKARRLISATSFILKGGGWYSDLYSTPKSGSKPEGSGASEGSSESKKESSSQGGSKDKGAAPSKPSKPSKPGAKANAAA